MNRRVCIVTRNYPSHIDLAIGLMENDLLAGIVLVDDKQASAIYENASLGVRFYLDERIKSEKKFFGDKYDNISMIKALSIDKSEINSQAVIDFISSLDACLTIFYDVDNIQNCLLQSIKMKKWKICEGYIQKFRGVYGNLFPFIIHRGEYATFSVICYDEAVDWGDIVYQVAPVVQDDDSITDVSFRAYRTLSFNLYKLCNKFFDDELSFLPQIESEGRVYSINDIRDEDIDFLRNEHNFMPKKLFNEGNMPYFFTDNLD